VLAQIIINILQFFSTGRQGQKYGTCWDILTKIAVLNACNLHHRGLQLINYMFYMFCFYEHERLIGIKHHNYYGEEQQTKKFSSITVDASYFCSTAPRQLESS